MSNANKTESQNKQSDARTEADKAAANSGAKDKSSGDEKSRTKAGTDHGAGGGAKQQQKH
jgi:hypothetical protein